ncbi:hypothetical protein BO78DRAFT_401945 [Aspergillus sclerotiicarbonarius CBS 121057]|uniref:Uncharacterized protein n=1 Tax=Aspergillus sclerotiicarbonarius (strain CBS 121057 / IBT 28362) TaxID=1448318 RepID=A0A319EA84_ASPSB|nr:hypothetical protein BO78DRAFT_401945 [Aspergillus sclerotiicarbonarius CBS 121057]
MTYMSSWHPIYNVPIVGGMFQNPIDGTIQTVTDNLVISGPPFVKATWINLNLNATFLITSTSFPPPVDQVFVAVADHVRDKAYTIESVNTSPYDMTVVCRSNLTQEAMSELLDRMKEDLWKDVHIPLEEMAEFEAFVEEERKENPRFGL